jgi:hypothetical protein
VHAEQGEEEEEPEAEATEGEGKSTAAIDEADMPIALPGLKSPVDLALLETWEASFVGTRLSAAATTGQILCHVPDLKCLVRLEAPPVRAVIDGIARCRAHRASFAADDADAEATAAAALDASVSEYSDADAADEPPALKLMVRTSPATLGATTAAAAAATAGVEPPPLRSVLRYQLPAAAVPPPLLAVMQVNDAPSRRADGAGLPRWHVYVRVQVQLSRNLPSRTLPGRLVVDLPKQSPPMKACTPKGVYSAHKNKARLWTPWCFVPSCAACQINLKVSGSFLTCKGSSLSRKMLLLATPCPCRSCSMCRP